MYPRNTIVRFALFSGIACLISMTFVSCTAVDETTVNVVLREFSVTPASESAPAGRITFHVMNDGDEGHEFLVIRTDLAPDALPTEEDGSYQENGPGTEILDEIGFIRSGSSEDLTLELEPGNYVLVCNYIDIEDDGEVEAHYALGMRAPFSVE